MSEYIANFWICGNPDEITNRLGVLPTSVRLRVPFDYWDYEIRTSENAVTEMIHFLDSIHMKLASMKQEYAMGITFRVETTDNGADTFHTLEANEIKSLSNFNLDIAFQTIFKSSGD